MSFSSSSVDSSAFIGLTPRPSSIIYRPSSSVCRRPPHIRVTIVRNITEPTKGHRGSCRVIQLRTLKSEVAKDHRALHVKTKTSLLVNLVVIGIVSSYHPSSLMSKSVKYAFSSLSSSRSHPIVRILSFASSFQSIVNLCRQFLHLSPVVNRYCQSLLSISVHSSSRCLSALALSRCRALLSKSLSSVNILVILLVNLIIRVAVSVMVNDLIVHFVGPLTATSPSGCAN